MPPIILAGAGIVTTTALGIASGLVLAVIAAIAGQLGRDRGKKLERGLWARWGGSPTMQRLRYRGVSREDRVNRLHGRIEKILGEPLPTAAEEAADPDAADDRYEEAAARIRALTHDRSRFGLLFAENVNYGQRRNLLGLRRAGVAVSVLTATVAVLLIGLAGGSFPERAASYGPGAAVAILMLIFWAVIVTPDWVRLTADAYAEQFVGAIDMLSTAGPSAS